MLIIGLAINMPPVMLFGATEDFIPVELSDSVSIDTVNEDDQSLESSEPDQIPDSLDASDSTPDALELNDTNAYRMMASVNRYEVEPNNSYTQANRTYDDDNMYGRITVTTDVDWFVVSFSSAGQANFWLGEIPSGCDYDLYLYASNGTNLLFSSLSAGNASELITYKVSANTNYYVKIVSYKGSSNSYYCFRAKNYPTAADRYEPNNTMAAATSISNNVTITDANIHTASDVDYYKFTISKASNATIDLTNIPSGCNYDLRLYNSTGTQISSSANSGNNPEKITATLNAGTYYIYVCSWSGYSNSNYRLALATSAAATADRYEPNNTMAAATSISNNTTITDANIHTASDVDYYKFTISTASNATIDLTNIPSGCDYDLRLYNSAGTQIGISASSSNNPEKITTTLNSGTYYVYVCSWSGFSNSSYRLALATTTSPTDPFSITGNISFNVPLTVNVASANQKKYYKFTAPNNGTYTFISYENGNCDPKGWLYNSAGFELDNDDDGSGDANYRISYTLDRGQVVYLAAGCWSTGTGTYKLVVVQEKTLAVPLYKQNERNTCGAASGRMVLASYGIAVTEEDFKNRAAKEAAEGDDFTYAYAVTRTINYFMNENGNQTRYKSVNISNYTSADYAALVLRNLSYSYPVIPQIAVTSNSGGFPYTSSGHYVVSKGMRYQGSSTKYEAVVNDSHPDHSAVYNVRNVNMLAYNKAHNGKLILCVLD
ncbi:MAG: pre-peptidase C-terminal domain-containing protein [Clostridiales bacterium]|nr:pre-peptidase C-terminal domain-containing protein [Clostridiales bacterium]